MINNILQKLYQAKRISFKQSQNLFNFIAQGKINSIELTAVLIGMKIRGEHPEEIAGAATAFLTHAKSFRRPSYPFADIVGTGGTRRQTMNVSTLSALVSVGCGAKVAKHGNYGVSNEFGAFDFLESLKVPFKQSPEESRCMLDKHGICFLLSPEYHTGFQHAMFVRKQLNTHTIFNILGPLINPARPPIALVGVHSPELVRPIADALKILGYRRTAVVHGGGLDEVALHAPTRIAELHDGEIASYTLGPKDFGLPHQSLESLHCASVQDRLRFAVRLLKGKGRLSHVFVVAANVSLLLKLFGFQDLKQNAIRAIHEINSGNAYRRVSRLTTTPKSA